MHVSLGFMVCKYTLLLRLCLQSWVLINHKSQATMHDLLYIVYSMLCTFPFAMYVGM